MPVIHENLPKVRNKSLLNRLIEEDDDKTDIVEASKAIYSLVMEKVPDYLEKALKPHVKELQETAGVTMGKYLQKELNDAMKALSADYEKRITDLQKQYEDLSTSHEKQLADIQEAFGEHHKSLMETAYQKAMADLEKIMRSMPVPNVQFPESAIKIEQSTPTLNMTLPENSIRVNVEQPIFSPHIEVRSAEQLAPIVNMSVPENAIRVNVQQPIFSPTVNVPEIKMPEINVPASRVTLEQPKPRKTRKTIVYDMNSRPEQIVEEEMETVSIVDVIKEK